MVIAAASLALSAHQANEQRRATKAQKKDVRRERAISLAASEQEKRTVTAAPADQDSEAARKNRRKSASFLTKDFAEPVLGSQGLTGA